MLLLLEINIQKVYPSKEILQVKWVIQYYSLNIYYAARLKLT